MQTQNPRAAITAALKILNPKNAVTELRILNTPRGTISGYYDNPDMLAEQAAAWSGVAPVYITLNPVKPELLARAQNRTDGYARTATGDQDILQRRWLPIDLDPVRPSGISSTDAEHEAAHDRAYQIVDFTDSMGWPDPIWADSGNGAHLDYRIDLPNDEASQRLVKRVLQAMDIKISDDKVSVDTGVDNAARIWKLYGTMACKGDNSQERPHRQAQILAVPKHLQVVTAEQLQVLADMIPVEPLPGVRSGSKLNLPLWIKKFKPPVSPQKPWNGGTVYVMNRCPWNPEHANGSAYIVQSASGAIAAGCHHNSCRDKKWADLRDIYEPGHHDDQDRQKKSQVDAILEDVGDIDLFHDSLNQAYARIDVDGHTETWPVKSDQFGLWLRYGYYTKTDKAANSEAVRTAQETIESKARFTAEERKVELRVAKHEDAFWYDLADKDWRAVKVTPEGWTIEAAPACFRRYGSTKHQVEPSRHGNLFRLLDFINFRGDGIKTEKAEAQDAKNQDETEQVRANKALFLVYVVACLVADIPHPIVVIHGGQGAAKSTALRVLQEVVDPVGRDLLKMSHNLQDLAIALRHNYMPSFDNLDSLKDEQSNLLCSACTGGGISKRMLYSDEDEVILSFKRCITLNGINVVANRPDLLDRSLLFELNRLDDEDRKVETAFWDELDTVKPDIVGGMFDILSKAMSIYPTVKLTKLPRMADFCKWGYAVAEALGIGGDKFVEYYRQNRDKSNREAISSDPVAVAVMAFLETRDGWKGTMTQFLNELVTIAPDEKIDTVARSWPKSASSLSAHLKRLISNLRDAGISCTIELSTAKATKNRSVVTLKKIGSKDPQQGSISTQDGTTYHIPGEEITHRIFTTSPPAPMPFPFAREASGGTGKEPQQGSISVQKPLLQTEGGVSDDSGDDDPSGDPYKGLFGGAHKDIMSDLKF